jgi:predicted metal-binding protein
MTDLKAHVFVCTNTRANGEASCGAKGSETFRKELKEEAKKMFGKSVRINASGCLGPCEQGIACVIYPQGEWKLNLTANDHDKEKLLTDIKNLIS